MKRAKARGEILLFLLLAAVTAYCQVPSVQGLSIVREENNKIQNDAYLEPFFEKLFQLRNKQRHQVNIVHIGDSHIQADFLTAAVRKRLQDEFGNAGRGLVVPARLAGTNEPVNFRSSSPMAWDSKRIIHTRNPMPIGIGGITISTVNESSLFYLKVRDPQTDYRFNTVGLFYLNKPNSFAIALHDSSLNQLALIPGKSDGTETAGYTRVSLPGYYDQIALGLKKQSDTQSQATLFGITLENGNGGLLYHAIGVNGAKYEHYNRASLFAEQTSYLSPDLFIISLGTNESVEYPNINPAFSKHVGTLISLLAQKNPGAQFILVTPPDAFLRKVRLNPGIETIRSQIIGYAVDNGISFWDMYKVNGGRNSAAEWKLKGLLRPDGIHFSKEGYAYQGSLLYEAIMKSYQQYVSLRY